MGTSSLTARWSGDRPSSPQPPCSAGQGRDRQKCGSRPLFWGAHRRRGAVLGAKGAALLGELPVTTGATCALSCATKGLAWPPAESPIASIRSSHVASGLTGRTRAFVAYQRCSKTGQSPGPQREELYVTSVSKHECYRRSRNLPDGSRFPGRGFAYRL